MKKFLKDYKEKFLNNLHAENQLEDIKKNLFFNNEVLPTKVSKKFLSPKRLISILASFVLVVVLGITTTLLVVNYQNTPVYLKMEVEDSPTVHRANLSNETNNFIANEIPDIKTDTSIKYFAPKESEIIIGIYISNPKKYEILSFTLNDYKYQSYEFQDGSTSDVIYVKVKCTSVSGVQEFYINELKYIDGTNIRNARYDGDRSIKIGVTYENIPTVEVLSENVTDKMYEVVFKNIDEDGLMVEGVFYKAYLFSREGLVRSEVMTNGLKSFKVDNLKMNTEYECLICCSVDLLDGKGYQTIYMYDKMIKTSGGLINPVIDTTENSVNATFNMLNETVKIVSSKLLVNDETYKEQVGSVVSFENVYSNTDYTIEVTYEYQVLNNIYQDTLAYEVKTKEYQIPEFDFTLDKTVDSIIVNSMILDEFDLGQITNIKLYLKDRLVDSNFDGETKTFIGLLSNNEYKVEITYTYNLNDQTGNHNIVVEHVITTDSYTDPTFKGDVLVTSFNQVFIDFELIDPDNVAKILNIALYSGETLIKDNLNMSDIISDIDSTYTEFKVVITYQYDMHDGQGITETTYTHIVSK